MRMPRYPQFGKFDFPRIEKIDKMILEEAFACVEAAKGWSYLAQVNIPGPDGFVYTNDPRLKEIMKGVNRDHYIKQSSGSVEWTMFQMEYIAKNGWPEFCMKWLSSH